VRRVDFEIFRQELNATLAYSDGGQGGRPPFDPVMMFKILVIQTMNNLSDERAESLINDRLSFMRFLGLGLSDRVPDARTIWLFREKLTKAGAIGPLFERFDATLLQSGYAGTGRRRPSIRRFQFLVIRTISRSIAALASSAAGARQTPPPMKAALCARDFLTRPTRRAAFGLTRVIQF